MFFTLGLRLPHCLVKLINIGLYLKSSEIKNVDILIRNNRENIKTIPLYSPNSVDSNDVIIYIT